DPDGACRNAPEARLGLVKCDRLTGQQRAHLVRLVVRDVAQIEKKLRHSSRPRAVVEFLSHEGLEFVNTRSETPFEMRRTRFRQTRLSVSCETDAAEVTPIRHLARRDSRSRRGRCALS